MTTSQSQITYDITDSRDHIEQTTFLLILIPAAERESGQPHIYAHPSIGNPSWPIAVHDGRHLAIGWPNNRYVAESLIETLTNQEQKLQQLSDAYLGSEWDGHQHRGKWDVETVDHVANHSLDLECETYTDAADWLAKSALHELITVDQSIDDAVDAIIDNARGSAVLDRDELHDALVQNLSSKINDDPDDDDDIHRHIRVLVGDE